MANHRPYTEREKVLDQRLSDGVGYTCRQLMAYCNAKAEERGYKPIKSKTTLLSDLYNIESSYHIIIEKETRGREIFYRYADSAFSVYNNGLSSAEVQQLHGAIDIISRFQGLPNFLCLDDLKHRFSISMYSDKHQSVVGFYQNEYVEGQDNFDELFNAITNKRTLKLYYHPFIADESMSVIIHPYYLKQYNNRWFLFGLNNKKNIISQFGLDRIKKTEPSGIEYIDTDIDWDEYFEDKIGVSGEGDPVSIELWLSPLQWKYSQAKPIHGSQKVIQRNEDGSAIIVLDVIPNYEFEQMVLGFGENIQVIAPVEIRNKIRNRILVSLKNYESVQINWTNSH